MARKRLDRDHGAPPREHFDAVIVGSGFGGSVTALRLADAGLSVCVLERGKSYPPGSFPRSPHEMARNFWDPSEGLYGMFDLWSFSGIEAVVASGLGGGSLIYANVLLRKDPTWFVHEPLPGGGYEDWPITYEDLEPHYERVERVMEVQPYPLDAPPYDRTEKSKALREAAGNVGLRWSLAPLAVTFRKDGRVSQPGEQFDDGSGNLHGKPRYTCRLVGECDIGCNFGSKNSVDFTYLSAARDSGADIRERCEVRSLRPVDRGFEVRYVEHPEEHEGKPLDTRRLPTTKLTCERLVLSAGALGTTYLLLRNRSMFPGLSSMLGARFSGNGDFLGFVFKAARVENGVRVPRILDPSYGPVITSYARSPDVVDGGTGRGFYIEDAGYPQFVNWLADEALPVQLPRLARFALRRAWASWTKSPKTEIGSALSGALGRNLFTATSVPLLGMGRDVPDGWMRLRRGYLDVRWTARNSRAYFDRVGERMQDIAGALGGHFLPDPLWWLSLLITVHPLGGCPMGEDRRRGVVDPWGQVFSYPGLSIADGSVMPGPVGANPSLTIAALADRFADRILDSRRGRTGRG
jgi:cholesterol oxidase